MLIVETASSGEVRVEFTPQADAVDNSINEFEGEFEGMTLWCWDRTEDDCDIVLRLADNATFATVDCMRANFVLSRVADLRSNVRIDVL